MYVMVQFQECVLAWFRWRRILNWPLKALVGRVTLLRNIAQRMKATMRNGTHTSRAFCIHIPFLITFLLVTSVIAPAAFLVTSIFPPLVGTTSVMAPLSSFLTSCFMALTVSVS